MFVWLTMALSRPFKEDRRVLPLSTPLSSRRSMVWCPWLCARRYFLRFLNTSDLPRSKPLVSDTLPAAPLLLNYTHCCRAMSLPIKQLPQQGSRLRSLAVRCIYLFTALLSLEDVRYKCKIWNPSTSLLSVSHWLWRWLSPKRIALKGDVTGPEKDTVFEVCQCIFEPGILRAWAVKVILVFFVW